MSRDRQISQMKITVSFILAFILAFSDASTKRQLDGSNNVPVKKKKISRTQPTNNTTSQPNDDSLSSMVSYIYENSEALFGQYGPVLKAFAEDESNIDKGTLEKAIRDVAGDYQNVTEEQILESVSDVFASISDLLRPKNRPVSDGEEVKDVFRALNETKKGEVSVIKKVLDNANQEDVDKAVGSVRNIIRAGSNAIYAVSPWLSKSTVPVTVDHDDEEEEEKKSEDNDNHEGREKVDSTNQTNVAPSEGEPQLDRTVPETESLPVVDNQAVEPQPATNDPPAEASQFETVNAWCRVSSFFGGFFGRK